MRSLVSQWLPKIGLILLAAVVYLVAGTTIGRQPAHALPEYAERTGEPCGACHVNPGGGGPRTMRGLLWTAQGRPEAIPLLTNVLLAPDVTDGAELYDIACASCHGFSGEGLFGSALVGTGVTESKVESTVIRGRERSGMPAYEGQFTKDQLQALVEFVTGIASGRIEPQPDRYPLPPAEFKCTSNEEPENCGGN
jgi:mono/diheme cytochrome c family protein